METTATHQTHYATSLTNDPRTLETTTLKLMIPDTYLGRASYRFGISDEYSDIPVLFAEATMIGFHSVDRYRPEIVNAKYGDHLMWTNKNGEAVEYKIVPSKPYNAPELVRVES